MYDWKILCALCVNFESFVVRMGLTTKSTKEDHEGTLRGFHIAFVPADHADLRRFYVNNMRNLREK